MQQPHRFTKAQLADAVASSETLTQALLSLGIYPYGGTHSHYSKRVSELGISTDHFITRYRISESGHPRGKKTAGEILSSRNEGRRTNRRQLFRALTEIGREYVCGECGAPPVWNDKPLVLQIDHIDGDSLNNCPENLRFLCPNCHTQTETWGSTHVEILCCRCKGPRGYRTKEGWCAQCRKDMGVYIGPHTKIRLKHHP